MSGNSTALTTRPERCSHTRRSRHHFLEWMCCHYDPAGNRPTCARPPGNLLVQDSIVPLSLSFVFPIRGVCSFGIELGCKELKGLAGTATPLFYARWLRRSGMHGKSMPGFAKGCETLLQCEAGGAWHEVGHSRVAKVFLENEAAAHGGQELETRGARVLVESIVDTRHKNTRPQTTNMATTPLFLSVSWPAESIRTALQKSEPTCKTFVSLQPCFDSNAEACKAFLEHSTNSTLVAYLCKTFPTAHQQGLHHKLSLSLFKTRLASILPWAG